MANGIYSSGINEFTVEALEENEKKYRLGIAAGNGSVRISNRLFSKKEASKKSADGALKFGIKYILLDKNGGIVKKEEDYEI